MSASQEPQPQPQPQPAPQSQSLPQPTSHPSPSPSITLHTATQSDLPSLTALQFQCFNHTVLIEKIANPDTPETRAAMISSHTHSLLEDPGMRIVKAVMSSSSSGDAKDETIAGFCIFHYPVPSSTEPGKWILPLPLRAMFDADPASAAVNAREVEMDSSPQVSADGTSQLSTATDETLPRGDPSAVPAASDDETGGNGIVALGSGSDSGSGSGSGSGSAQIQISQTNIPTLLPGRKRTLNGLVAQRARYAADWPPPLGYVRYIYVSPMYRRHGIGGRLMEWGRKRFDELGVDAYLEATVEGQSMYERFGFTVVGKQVLKVYGVEGVEGERYACMWRDVRAGGGERVH